MKELWDLNKDEYDLVIREIATKTFNLLKNNKNYILTFGDYSHPSVKNMLGIALFDENQRNIRSKYFDDIDNMRKDIFKEIRDKKIEKILN